MNILVMMDSNMENVSRRLFVYVYIQKKEDAGTILVQIYN